MPVFLKRDMTDQLPELKKQNLKNADYANKSVQDLFTSSGLHNAVEKTFNYAFSVIAFNRGDGKFTIQTFPPEVQMSSVNVSLCTDVNNDGFTDIILGGNNFGFPPQFGRLDAGFGSVLLNDGNGHFKIASSKESGLLLRGQARDIKEISAGNKKYLLVLQNNEYPRLYEETRKK